METHLIAPHGGTLINRCVDEATAKKLDEKSGSMAKLALNERQINDLDMIAVGAFSPLTGFMTQKDYDSVVSKMRLANGLVWSIPITLQVTNEQAAPLKTGTEIALMGPDGKLMAVMELSDKWTPDQKLEAKKVYRTEEEAHPGVAAVYQGGPVYLGGAIHMVRRPTGLPFSDYRNDPAQTRKYFNDKGWKTVVAFQTRNPIHRAHEYLQKCAMELVDGLMIHPLVGATKSDDIPPDVRMDCYKVLLDNYYPKDRVLLSVFPANMRYAGPSEAILHAVVRKNYGCTHIIIGRDHAGAGNYYGSYDAQHIFRDFKPEDLGITPMFFENSFFCRTCNNLASSKTCPHPDSDRVALSGTKVREMLAGGQRPPVEFSRAEVADILIKHYKKTG